MKKQECIVKVRTFEETPPSLFDQSLPLHGAISHLPIDLEGVFSHSAADPESDPLNKLMSPYDTSTTIECIRASLPDTISMRPFQAQVPPQIEDLHHYYRSKCLYWDKLDEMINDRRCQKVLKRDKLRARYFGYLYQILAYNDISYAVREEIQGILRIRHIFEQDTSRLPWLISCSGSEYVDTEANIFAAWMMQREQAKKAHAVLLALHTGMRDILLASIVSFLRKPCILPVEPEEVTPDAICKYLLLFATPKQSVEELERTTENDIHLPRLSVQDYDRIFRDRTMFAVKGVDTCFKKPNWPVVLSEYKQLDESSLTGIRLSEIIGTEQVAPATVRDPARAMRLDAANDAMMMALRLQDQYCLHHTHGTWATRLNRASERINHLENENRALSKELFRAMMELDEDDTSEQEGAQPGDTEQKPSHAQKIARLEALVESLRATVADKSKQVEALSEQLDNERANREAAEQEVEALLRMKEEQTAPTEAELNTLDTSIFQQKKVIVLGGHKTWVRGMKSLHPDIEYYDHDVPFPPINAITSSDMIWFQVNAINHPAYYRAVALAKTNNIPFRFFSSAGHQFCRKQMVSETNEYFSSKKQGGN